MATDLFADLGDDIFDDPSLAAYTSPNPIRNRRVVPSSAPTHLHQNHQGISSEPFDFDDHPPGFDPVTNRRKRKRRATDNVISLIDDDCPPGFDPVTNRRKRKRTQFNPISNTANQSMEYGRNQQQGPHTQSNTISPISPTSPSATNSVPQTPRPFHSHSRSISGTNNFNGNANGINNTNSINKNHTNSFHQRNISNSNGHNTTFQAVPFRTPQPVHRRNNGINATNRSRAMTLSANRITGERSHHNTNTNAMRPSRNIQSVQNTPNRQSTTFTPLQPIRNINQSNYQNTPQSVQMNQQNNRSNGHSNGYTNSSVSSMSTTNPSHSNHIPVNQQSRNQIPSNHSAPHSVPPASNRSPSTTNSNASNASNFEDPIEDIPESPECSHKQPMVQRVTRKMGPNQGRKFWCCGMAQQDKCKSFKWDDAWQQELRVKRRNQPKVKRTNKSMVLSTELLCIDPNPLFLVTVTPSSHPFLAALRKCKNAVFNYDKKKWTVPLDQHSVLIANQQRACKQEGYLMKMDVIPNEVIHSVQQWKSNQNQEVKPLDKCMRLLPQKLRDSLYEFQKNGFHFAIQKEGRCLIADEMGLGKSIQAIAVAVYYRVDWPLLIIAPSSLILTWKMEILKWLSGTIYESDINIIKKGSDKMIDYDETDYPIRKKAICQITIISYGLATKKRDELLENDNLFGVVIIDESHKLKNYDTQRCQALLPFIKNKVKRAIFLSGTPTNNRPAELHAQIDALRPGEFMSFTQYTVRYCQGQQGKFGWEARGAMHLKELHAMIKHRVMIRREKKEVLNELPDKIRTVVTIECDKSMAKKLAKKLERHHNLTKRLSVMASQYTPAVADLSSDRESDDDDDGDEDEVNAQDMGESEKMFNRKNSTMLELYSMTGKSKLPKIIEYVKDTIENGEKFLVFAHHLDVLDEIKKSVQKSKVGFIQIDGRVPASQRQKLVDDFQNDTEIRVAILSITAAGTGLTLTAATTVVIAELHWTAAALLQCEGRAHRISQTSVVNIVYLLGKGSLDDKMWPMVKRKMEVTSQTMNGKKERMEVEEYKKHYEEATQRITDHYRYENENENENQDNEVVDEGDDEWKPDEEKESEENVHEEESPSDSDDENSILTQSQKDQRESRNFKRRSKAFLKRIASQIIILDTDSDDSKS